MRCLLHSLAVGVSIMRVTEGCLCVGECFSAFCVCMYSMCVCVFEMHNNISSLPVFHGDKGWLLRLQPQWQGEMSQSTLSIRKTHTDTLLHKHARAELTQHRHHRRCGYGLPDKLGALWVFLHCAGCLSRRRRSQLCKKNKKNTVCLLCGNAGNANLKKKTIIQANIIFSPAAIQIDS